MKGDKGRLVTLIPTIKKCCSEYMHQLCKKVREMKYPTFLQDHETIGFIAPSFGCASLEPYISRFRSALEYFKGLGYSTIVGPNVYADSGIGKSNTPEKCGEEINDFFTNDKSNVIISVGGGETMCEDLPFVDFEKISASKPHWFLGYSDNTNLTFTLPTLCDIAAVYGPCASSFGMKPQHPYLTDTLDFLTGKKMKFKNYDYWESESKSCEETPLATLNATEPFALSAYFNGKYYGATVSSPVNQSNSIDPFNVEFSGRLLGGCLDILTILSGTKFDKVKEFNKKYEADGIIWFLESCDLNPLSITRSIWQLKNAGWFEKTRGFLIGRPLHYNENIMGLDCTEAVIRILKDYNVPIILDIDLGHLPPQMPLVSGAIGNVKVIGNSLSICYELK